MLWALGSLWCVFLEAHAGLAAINLGNWAPVAFQTGLIFLGEENLSQPLVSAQLEVKLSLGLLAGVGDIS